MLVQASPEGHRIQNTMRDYYESLRPLPSTEPWTEDDLEIEIRCAHLDMVITDRTRDRRHAICNLIIAIAIIAIAAIAIAWVKVPFDNASKMAPAIIGLGACVGVGLGVGFVKTRINPDMASNKRLVQNRLNAAFSQLLFLDNYQFTDKKIAVLERQKESIKDVTLIDLESNWAKRTTPKSSNTLQLGVEKEKFVAFVQQRLTEYSVEIRGCLERIKKDPEKTIRIDIAWQMLALLNPKEMNLANDVAATHFNKAYEETNNLSMHMYTLWGTNDLYRIKKYCPNVKIIACPGKTKFDEEYSKGMPKSLLPAFWPLLIQRVFSKVQVNSGCGPYIFDAGALVVRTRDEDVPLNVDTNKANEFLDFVCSPTATPIVS